jgi:hypothetical protein
MYVLHSYIEGITADLATVCLREGDQIQVQAHVSEIPP